MSDIENDEIRKILTFAHEFWAMNSLKPTLLLTELLNYCTRIVKWKTSLKRKN